MKLWYSTIPALVSVMLFFSIQPSMCCNKALCASDVSKCLIQNKFLMGICASLILGTFPVMDQLLSQTEEDKSEASKGL